MSGLKRLIPFKWVPDNSVCVFPSKPDAMRPDARYRKHGCFAVVLDEQGLEIGPWIRWHNQEILAHVIKEDITSARS